MSNRKDDRLTVAALIASYMEFSVGYYVKKGHATTEVGLIKATMAIVERLYGEKSAVEFGPKALKSCRDAMIEKDWCRTHINRQMERIKRMFKWATAEELVPGSVYEALRCVAGLKYGRTKAREGPVRRPVSEGDVAASLPYMPEIVADMVRVQQVTGMRPQEMCMMRPMDLDRSGPVWVYTPDSHKMEHHGRERTIFIGPAAQIILQKYLARPADSCCFRPCDTVAKHRAKLSRMMATAHAGNRKAPEVQRSLLPQAGGLQYNAASYGNAVRRAARRAGVPTWSPYRLRHSFATMVRKQYGLEAAQVLLGHAQANVTQIYAQRDMDLAARVAKEVG